MNLGESIYLKCDCGGCSILEFNFDEEDKQFYVAMWVSHPGTQKLSKKERIRWCEHIMKTGKPWTDHTIVNKLDAQRLVEFINKQIAKYGKSKNGS